VTADDFTYRSQSFCGDSIIVAAEIILSIGDSDQLQRVVKEMVQERKQTQPLQYPNCGSLFRNPPQKTAGRLIQSAGLRGFRIGNAMISEKHGNFILNLGGAKARDILSLIHKMEEAVQYQFGIELKREGVVIGN